MNRLDRFSQPGPNEHLMQDVRCRCCNAVLTVMECERAEDGRELCRKCREDCDMSSDYYDENMTETSGKENVERHDERKRE